MSVGDFLHLTIPREGPGVGGDAHVGTSHFALEGRTLEDDGKGGELATEHDARGCLGSGDLTEGGELALDRCDDVEVDVGLIVTPAGGEDQAGDECLSVLVDDVVHGADQCDSFLSKVKPTPW